MLLALRIMLSVQFEGFEFELPPNQEFELDGIHDELELIDGNHDEEDDDGYQDDEEPEGSQLDEDPQEFDDEEDISEEPSTTPTPRPMPNTASTVERG